MIVCNFLRLSYLPPSVLLCPIIHIKTGIGKKLAWLTSCQKQIVEEKNITRQKRFERVDGR